ncbi:MAG: stage II sporulation protein M [Myxococcota bacterium]
MGLPAHATPPATRPSPADARRDTDFERFVALLARAEKAALRGLAFDELRELGRLYRLLSARLARARSRDADPDATRALNAALVRGYTLLYGQRLHRRSLRPSLARVADAVARSFAYQMAAWALLVLGAVAGAGLVIEHPPSAAAFVPASLGYSPERVELLATSAAARAEMLARDATPASHNALFGTYLLANNTRVGLLSLAVGVLGGIPTALLQLYNGLVLGALAGIFLPTESALAFALWVGPHGVPEIEAICLCAAAGLQLGFALIAPGRKRVREALRDAGDSALALFAVAVPLLVLAAVVESFVRESALGSGARAFVLVANAALVAAILLGSHRVARARAGAIDTSWLAAQRSTIRSAAPGSG